MSPIKGLMFKIARAKVHLDALSEAVELWRESQAKAPSAYDDLERGEHIIEFRPPDLDIRVALIAGDFISCLRSSLDHLAWQLAATNKAEPSNRICFPILAENTLDSQLAFTKATFGIPDEAIITIRSLQPYHGGKSYKDRYLWILNTLWNIDKHRHIPLNYTVCEFTLEARSARPIDIQQLDNYAKMTFNIADKPNIKFQPMPRPEVYFGNEKEGVRVTVDQLRTIYESVRNEIIPAFACFFPQSEGIGE
jgi:hypothetical protein